MTLERDVFSNAHARDQAFALAVVGDVRDAKLRSLRKREARDIASLKSDPAMIDCAETDDRFGQLLLPISVNSSDPEDFPRMKCERHVAKR